MTDDDGAALIAENDALRRAFSEQSALVDAMRAVNVSLEGRNAALESALVGHANEIELLRRKLFGPRSERGGTSELQLALGNLLAGEAALKQQLDALVRQAETDRAAAAPAAPSDKPARKPSTGRRNLSTSTLPKVVVEITDPQLAARGELAGFDDSYQLIHDNAAWKVLVRRTAKYKLPVAGGAPGATTVLGVLAPKSLFPKSLLHTSAIAWLAVEKFALGVPHYRLEQHLADVGVPLDRGTMGRYMEDLGSTLGATVVRAMLDDARATCQVLATDATGAAIQPVARDGSPRRSCDKGHFFAIVADRDHILFEYTKEHSSAVVARLFAGFTGFLQTDASSVYDILEHPPPSADEAPVVLVGCWAHARRYFFEAAVCKYPLGVEGLVRIRALYRAERALAKLAPEERQRERLVHVGPLVDDFFAWVRRTKATEPGRTLASKALGYAANQEAELRRFLLDGRLPLDNTRSERALRKIVIGRKNWLFYGSDLHATAAAAIFSIIASCRLHALDPGRYLDEVMRVLPYWPRERHVELAPKYWLATRATLDSAQLDKPVAAITVPPSA